MYLDTYFKPLRDLEPEAIISQLEQLLANQDTTESQLQRFISEHSYLILPLSPRRSLFAVAQARLDDEYVVDFALYGEMNVSWWTFVEIEPHSARLFTKSGDPSSKFTHALQQTYDWERWRESSSTWAQVFGDGTSRPHLYSMLLIGRRDELGQQEKARLKSYGFVYTYDSLLEMVRSALALRPDTVVQAKAIPWADFRSIRRETSLYSLRGDFERITGTLVYARAADHSMEFSDKDIQETLAGRTLNSVDELVAGVVEVCAKFIKGEHVRTPSDTLLLRLFGFLSELRTIRLGYASTAPRKEIAAYQHVLKSWKGLADYQCADLLAQALDARFGDRSSEIESAIRLAVQTVDLWHHSAYLTCQNYARSLLVPGWCEPERDIYSAELAIMRAGGVVTSNLVINRDRHTLAVLS